MRDSSVGRRRQFLFGAGAASVAAAAMVVVKPPAAVRPAAGKGKSETGSGYQLTEHVRNYYRTTAV